jgi:hypothetical protein
MQLLYPERDGWQKILQLFRSLHKNVSSVWICQNQEQLMVDAARGDIATKNDGHNTQCVEWSRGHLWLCAYLILSS